MSGTSIWKLKRRYCYGNSSFDFWLSEVMGIKGIPTPYRAPNANSYCERLLGTLRRECLDNMLILNDRHLYRIMEEYITWYNCGRYHQGIDGIPDPYSELQGEKPEHGEIISIPVLNGLHHDYRLAA